MSRRNRLAALAATALALAAPAASSALEVHSFDENGDDVVLASFSKASICATGSKSGLISKLFEVGTQSSWRVAIIYGRGDWKGSDRSYPVLYRNPEGLRIVVDNPEGEEYSSYAVIDGAPGGAGSVKVSGTDKKGINVSAIYSPLYSSDPSVMRSVYVTGSFKCSPAKQNGKSKPKPKKKGRR